MIGQAIAPSLMLRTRTGLAGHGQACPNNTCVGDNEEMGLFFLRGISMAYMYSPRGAHITMMRGSGMARIKPMNDVVVVEHQFSQHVLFS